MKRICKKSLNEQLSRYFTLIELLLVISIIAILAAILLPALKRAKDKGYQIICINNCKSINLCISMYINDWDGGLPKASITNIKTYLGMSDDASTKKVPAFMCPSADQRLQEWSGYVNSICMNNYLGSVLSGTDGILNSRDVKRPQNTILCTDSRMSRTNSYGHTYYETTWQEAQTRHFKQASYGMLDNHVESLRPEDGRWDNTPYFQGGRRKWDPTKQ